MIFSENRDPLFQIMLEKPQPLQNPLSHAANIAGN
jgi:hypothetical protein